MESAASLRSSLGRWTLVASILGSSMAFVDGSVVNVALKAIESDLGGGLASQQWVVDAYLLTLGSLILVGGSLGDIYGELRIFGIGVASFAGPSVLCPAAPNETARIVLRRPQSVAGALLCVAGLGLRVAGFIEQPHLGWGSPLVWGGILGGVALLAVFVVYELHTPMPMLPLRLFRLRNFSVTNVETFAVYGALSGLTVFLTLFLLEFSGYSAFHAGLALLPVTVVMFFLSPRTG